MNRLGADRICFFFSFFLLNQTAISFLQESLKVTRSSWQYTFLFKFLSCTRTGCLFFSVFFLGTLLWISLTRTFVIRFPYTHFRVRQFLGPSSKVSVSEWGGENKTRERIAICARGERRLRTHINMLLARERRMECFFCTIFYEQFNLSLTSDLRPINQQKEHRNCEET